ncbi:MAG: DUF5107 domain-containing protein, partial [Candidatus Marinimicrobia bacterium]|nr:DUF5107 domain-containing protein [Candidatus Neomarinimicrobiota bacterium]
MKKNLKFVLVFAAGIILFTLTSKADCKPSFEITTVTEDSIVRIWEEPLIIPTYEVDKPDPNPRFYAGRAYQGAQGRIYPYPMLDRLTDNRKDISYNAVYLENEYIKICVLPGIGGRIFYA